MELKQYTVGALAYFDALYGLVPCKVTHVYTYVSELTARKETRVTAIVTADRHAYHKGTILESEHVSKIIPRESVYRSRQHCGQLRIRNNYEWIKGDPELKELITNCDHCNKEFGEFDGIL